MPLGRAVCISHDSSVGDRTAKRWCGLLKGNAERVHNMRGEVLHKAQEEDWLPKGSLAVQHRDKAR